jgi:hypothetical protein
VTLQIDDHPRDAKSYVFGEIARCWRVPREQVLEVMRDWTAEQLEEHLCRFTSQELKPPAFRR